MVVQLPVAGRGGRWTDQRSGRAAPEGRYPTSSSALLMTPRAMPFPPLPLPRTVTLSIKPHPHPQRGPTSPLTSGGGTS